MQSLSVKMLINKVLWVFNKKLTPIASIMYNFKCQQVSIKLQSVVKSVINEIITLFCYLIAYSKFISTIRF